MAYFDGIMLFWVLISLLSIGGFTYFINKNINDIHKSKEALTKFVSIILAVLVALFVIDKIIGFQFKLLTDEMSQSLFELIKNIVLVVFGYQFGGKINERGPRDL